MSTNQNLKVAERNISGMMNRHERFAEAEHADNIRATLKRIITYFSHEKTLVICMLVTVISGTLCGIYAPSLQSGAVDIIAGENRSPFTHAANDAFCISALYLLWVVTRII